MASRSRLTRLIQRFVAAESWAASRVFAERHPALLSDDADEILTGLAAAASARGDGAAAHAYEVHQAALRRYRERGAAAFDRHRRGQHSYPPRQVSGIRRIMPCGRGASVSSLSASGSAAAITSAAWSRAVLRLSASSRPRAVRL